MILTGNEIKKRVNKNEIRIDPLIDSQVNPNSYDLCLGDELLKYDEDILETSKENRVNKFKMNPRGEVLEAGKFYLGHSRETVGSDFFVPIIHAKSGIARLGLFVHATADLLDLGFHGQITFQFVPTVDITIYSGMKIAQVSFWKPLGEISLYTGKYQNSIGPQSSRSYLSE